MPRMASIAAFCVLPLIGSVRAEEEEPECETQLLIDYDGDRHMLCQNQCMPQGCNDDYEVTTNEGNPGVVCVCDIIGPQPNCCRLAITGPSSEEPAGECGLLACGQPAGNCSIKCWIVLVEGRTFCVGDCQAKPFH